MLEMVDVSILDRIAHHLFDSQVGGKNNFPRGAVGFEKFSRRDRDNAKVVQVITYFESKSGHGETSLHAKEGSKLPAQQDTRANDCRSEEAHGPNSERAGDEASFTEQLVELIDRFRDGIILLFLCQDQRVADF